MQALAIPLGAFDMLIPVNMVAQITGVTDVSASELSMPNIEGNIQWRDYQVPLIRAGELISGVSGIDDGYKRIVVLWPMKTADKKSFMAFVSKSAPKVVDIVSQSAPEHHPEFNYVLGYVDLMGGLAVIPDIERISTQLFSS